MKLSQDLHRQSDGSPEKVPEKLSPIKEIEKGVFTQTKILKTFSKKSKHRAERLMHFIEDSGEDTVAWNKKGQLIYKGEILPDTNIVDLIHDAVTLRKGGAILPIGGAEFCTGLALINVPKSLIINKDRRELIDRYKSGESLPALTPSQDPESEIETQDTESQQDRKASFMPPGDLDSKSPPKNKNQNIIKQWIQYSKTK